MIRRLKPFFSYPVLIVLSSLIPLILFGIFTYESEKQTHLQETLSNLKAINKTKKNDIIDYFNTIEFELNELKSNIHFLQQQTQKHIQNIQDLQAQNILFYYQSLEKIIISLAKDSSFNNFYNIIYNKQTLSSSLHKTCFNLIKNLHIKNFFLIDKHGMILYSNNLHLRYTPVQQLSDTFAKAWPKIEKTHNSNDVHFVEFGYNKQTHSFKHYIITHLLNSDGYIAFEIDTKPIDTILHNVNSLGKTAESYLIYTKENNTTALASNRIVKQGMIGDNKTSQQIEKGFSQTGVEIKYGSTGAIELVGFRPFCYKNLKRTLQTTVRYIDIISPVIKTKSYFQSFVQDYHFHNLLLVSSKGKVIYSLKHPKENTNTTIEKLFTQVLHSKHYFLSDIVPYNRCHQKYAQFAIAPLLNGVQDVEIVLFLQLDIEALSHILQKNDLHYYKTLDYFILNTQAHLRSETLLQSYDANLSNIYTHKTSIFQKEVNRFQENNQTVFYAKDYRNHKTLAVFTPLFYNQLQWIMVSKIDISELTAMSYSIKQEVVIFILFFSFLATIIIAVVSYYKKKHEEKLLFLATHDTLTKLPNRNFIFDTLEYILADAQRKQTQGALLFMDLDNFKFINDSYGHENGDFVLKEVAQRLKHILRHNDILARLGGDEFLIIIPTFHTLYEIDTICHKIIETLSKPIEDTQHIYQIGVSIGIATFPQNSTEPKELLQYADTAMYKTKAKGRNGFTYYSKEMTEHSLNASRVKTELQFAIENNQLQLYYQPQIDILTQKIVGVEALVRWLHPRDGLIMPNNFIPIAEENNLIIALDQWVLKKACQDFKSWKKSGYNIDYIAVNMSAKQLAHHGCSTFIATLLEEMAFEPQWLELEITENTLITNFERVSSTMETFKKMGIGFSIDDFGTGYSSLTYLKSLQIETLKIDREFIKDILIDKDDLSIVKAVINMGHALNYKIIAEGAEDIQTVALLRELSCDVIQGYIYAKPLRELELLEFMDTNEKETYNAK